MKLFIAYMLLCFIGATMLRRRDLKSMPWILFSVVTFVCIAYIFFKQI